MKEIVDKATKKPIQQETIETCKKMIENNKIMSSKTETFLELKKQIIEQDKTDEEKKALILKAIDEEVEVDFVPVTMEEILSTMELNFEELQILEPILQ